jgi:hypothetical protein
MHCAYMSVLCIHHVKSMYLSELVSFNTIMHSFIILFIYLFICLFIYFHYLFYIFIY